MTQDRVLQAQLQRRGRAMLRVIAYFAKSLKVIEIAFLSTACTYIHYFTTSDTLNIE